MSSRTTVFVLVRRLVRDRASLFTVALLGITVAAAATVAQILNEVVWNPLAAIAQPERVVMLGGISSGAAIGNPIDWWSRAPGLEGLARYRAADATLPTEFASRNVRVAAVTSGFFSVLGTGPVFGRNFTRDDELSPENPALMSWSLWRSTGSSNFAPLQLKVNNLPVTVIGVLPAAFEFPSGTQLWFVEPAEGRWSQILPASGTSLPALPPGVRSGWIGRLRPAASVQQVQEQAGAILRETNDRLSPVTGLRYGDVVTVEAATDVAARPYRRALESLAVGIGFLLVAIWIQATIATLGRCSRYRSEFALRLVLGARLGHLAKFLILDAAVIAMFGFGAALIASLGFETVARKTLFYGGAITRSTSSAWLSIALGSLVFSFLITGIANSIPIWQLRRVDINSILQHARGSLTLGLRPGIRRFTIGLGAAAAVALAVAGVLAVRSMNRLSNTERGFQGDPVVVDVRFSRELAKSGIREAQNGLLDAIRTNGGSVSAGFGSALPLTANDRRFIAVDGGNGPFMASVCYQAGSFLSSIGSKLLAGRDSFDGSEGAAIVNEAFARRISEGTPAIGRHIRVAGALVQIVGVVTGTVAAGESIGQVPEVYLPYASSQSTSPSGVVSYLAVRCDGRSDCSETFGRFVIEFFRDRPGVVVTNTAALSDRVARSVAPVRTQTAVMVFLALTSAAMAILSAVTIVAFVTSSRRPELAIRRSLGATRPAIAWLVGYESIVAGAVGAATGGIVCRLLGRGFEYLLGPDMFPSDAILIPTAIVVALIIGVSALLAPMRIVRPWVSLSDLQGG